MRASWRDDQYEHAHVRFFILLYTRTYTHIYTDERIIMTWQRTHGSLLFIIQYLEHSHYLDQQLPAVFVISPDK